MTSRLGTGKSVTFFTVQYFLYGSINKLLFLPTERLLIIQMFIVQQPYLSFFYKSFLEFLQRYLHAHPGRRARGCPALWCHPPPHRHRIT
jgi:hypothetical protein